GPTAPPLLQTYRYVRAPCELLESCRERYGKTFTLRFVRERNLVLTSDPAVVREVYAGSPARYLSGAANANFRPFFGPRSVVVVDGDEHRRARRLLMPPFRGERMAAFAELIGELTVHETRRWPLGTPFPLLDSLQRLTLDVIVAAVFGAREAERRERIARLVLQVMRRTSGALAFLPFLQVDLGPLSPWGRYRRLHRRLSNVFREEIARARREARARDDLLARLIVDAEERGLLLDDDFLHDQLLTLIAAGHDTTATALGWTFLYLLGDPEVLARARAEVSDVLGEEPARAEHVPRLRYLDAVAQEALRLHPPIPVVVRLLAEDTELAGHSLPRGTLVCPCAYLLHREPELYADPLRFRPERFLDDRPRPYEFSAFGGGARTCLGMGFAYFEMKVVLATLLSRARLQLAEPPSRAYARRGVVLVPRRGTRVLYEGGA
ncbi:MAG: cytochrome P450, partial [Planctomycetota bacterium]